MLGWPSRALQHRAITFQPKLDSPGLAHEPTMRAAIGKEQGYTLRVARFASLGFAVPAEGRILVERTTAS
jgi:hypothetical protein